MTQHNDLASLMHHLVSLLSRQSDQVLQEQLGIGLSQYKIMSTLHEHPHIQQKVIASSLGQTEASISRQIKLLTEKGMLNALKNPANQREHITDLTARGVRMIEAAEKVLNHHHHTFFAELSKKEQASMYDALSSLHHGSCTLEHPGAYNKNP
jgi:DNA-binding MarR family transcriptional regulator